MGTELRRFMQVAAIGAVGIGIQFVFFEVVSIRTGLLAPSLTAVLGGEIALLINFFLNNSFTFKHAIQNGDSWLKRFIRFHVVVGVSLIIQWLIVAGAERTTADPLSLRVALLIGIGIGFVTNYIGYSLWVWRKKN